MTVPKKSSTPAKPKRMLTALDGYKTLISVIVLSIVGVAKSRGWVDGATAELLMTLAGGGALLSIRHAVTRKKK